MQTFLDSKHLAQEKQLHKQLDKLPAFDKIKENNQSEKTVF